MKLKVGMYVRTKEFGIKKIKWFDNEEPILENGFTALQKGFEASNNIIDLIKEGDYVNGDRVTETMIKMRDEQGIFGLPDVWNMYIEEIKIISIVTKEQFESMQYKVGE